LAQPSPPCLVRRVACRRVRRAPRQPYLAAHGSARLLGQPRGPRGHPGLLIGIGQEELLPGLFKEVVVPAGVRAEIALSIDKDPNATRLLQLQ
jgi:hypothetical protein